MKNNLTIQQYSNSVPRIIIILLYCCIALSSCGFLKKEKESPDEKPVAKVFDKYLYASDLQGLVKSETPGKDSAEIVNNYIDNWIRKNLVLHVAEQNLTEEQKNIEKQLNDYRESLFIFLYEKAIVNQKLDTSVNENEREEYYRKYKMNFALKNNLLKIKFVISKRESPGIDSVKYWLKSGNEKLSRLQKFSLMQSLTF